jgi:predicted AlkP superfamily pyrophosphatase or phosphodiesterase
VAQLDFRNVFAVIVLCAFLPPPGSAQKHVIVFGVDGLSPEGIAEANTPNIHQMMKEGAWSMHARAVIPTVSSPNWAAMIMGAPTEMTGITSNEWQPNKFTIAPACQDAPGIFPTIFGLEHAQHAEAKVAIFTDWPDFVRLVEPGVVEKTYATDEKEDEAFSHALDYLHQAAPELLFIHLDHVDGAGHRYGWGTPQYLAAVEKADRMLGELMGTLDSLHLRSTTTVLLTADHGGTGKSHGGLSMSELLIPWILSGPGIQRDHEISENIMQYDTAATLAVLLHVRPSPCWRGKAVQAAFVPQTP